MSLSDSESIPLVGARSSLPVPGSHGGGVGGRALMKLGRRHSITLGEVHRTAMWRPEDSVNSMSAAAFVVNMFADLCPPGLLPLAAGLRGTGLLPALLLLLVLGSACVYTMWTVGRTCEITGCQTFRGQWAVTLGEQTAWVPVAVVVLVCFGCNLSYSCFFADIFASVMPSFGLSWASRDFCLIIFTLCPLLPLCMLKDLSALAYSSFVALVVVIYTTGVMCLRAIDGSYARHGQYFEGLEHPPDVPTSHMLDFGLSSLLLVNFLAMGYLSHYNGCKYYRELRGHTPFKLWQCTSLGMGITSIFYAVSAVAAFETFGTNACGVILENYAKNDNLINIARVGMGLSIIASFPLMFSGLREAVIELMIMMQPQWTEPLGSLWIQNVLSACLLLAVTHCAWMFTDAQLVVGIVGAVCGSAVIYMIPCVLYAEALGKVLNKEHHLLEIAIARSVAMIGMMLGVIGLITVFLF